MKRVGECRWFNNYPGHTTIGCKTSSILQEKIERVAPFCLDVKLDSPMTFASKTKSPSCRDALDGINMG